MIYNGLVPSLSSCFVYSLAECDSCFVCRYGVDVYSLPRIRGCLCLVPFCALIASFLSSQQSYEPAALHGFGLCSGGSTASSSACLQPVVCLLWLYSSAINSVSRIPICESVRSVTISKEQDCFLNLPRNMAYFIYSTNKTLNSRADS